MHVKTNQINDMKKVLFTWMCLACSLASGAQAQQGIVRTLERPSKPSVGIEGVTINVHEYPNAIVSKKGGKFAFTLSGKRLGESFTMTRVHKKGYSLVDKQVKGRRYAYSPSVPIEIVMVSDQQLEKDKKLIEDKAYDKAQKDFDKKLAALEKQLKEKSISEREYRQKYEELNNNYSNYVQLIDQMAERYAMTDYSGMDDVSKEILACLENADLERADQLINSKGSFDKREKELLSKLELKEKSEELSQQLEKDIEKERNSLVQDYYNKYYINASNYHNDSAAYYLERIVKLAPGNSDILYRTARFIMDYLSDYPRAEGYFLQALEQAKLQHGELSEEVGVITDDLGLLYDNMLDYDKAIEWHQRALDILEPTVGSDNKTVSMAYTLIGRAYMNKKMLDKALEYTLKGLEIRERMDINDPQISQSYNNLGVIYNTMGDLDKALEYHKKALEIREQAYGPDDGATALSYNNIGSILISKGEFDEAIDWLNRGLAINEKIFGPVNPYTANGYNSLGYAHYFKGDLNEAVKWFMKQLSSYEQLYGYDSIYNYSCCEHIAVIHEQLGDTAQALKYYQRCMDLLQPHGDTYQEQTEQLKSHIQELKSGVAPKAVNP